MNSTPKTKPDRGSDYAAVNKCKPADLDTGRPADYHIAHALVQRNWIEVREKLLERFPVLQPEDVNFQPEKKEEMMRALEEKLELSPAKLQRIIAEI